MGLREGEVRESRRGRRDGVGVVEEEIRVE